MIGKKTKSFTQSVIILLAAQIIVKVLGMLYRMVITNMDGFGDIGNGYYSAGFQVYTLLLALSSVGIPNAISKLISERTALSDHDGADQILKAALIIFAVIGAVLSAGLYLFAKPIADDLLDMDGAKYTLAALSPSIFFVCISSVFRGYFSGINRVQFMSISQIIEQVLKSALTIIFVFFAIGSSPEWMAAYANLATTAATVCGTVYLVFIYFLKKEHNALSPAGGRSMEFYSVAREILKIAVPISLCSIISAVNRIIDTATITRGIETAFAGGIPAYGNAAAIANPSAAQLDAAAVRLSGMLSKSDTLINLPLALNIALATVLVPSISACCARGDTPMIQKYIRSSYLASVILILPCAVGYAVLAAPIYHLIYPNASLGYALLQFGTVSLVFTALNQTMTGALQGVGKVYVPAFALFVGCVVKLIANRLLISMPQINIYGAVIGSALCQLTVFVIEFYHLSKYLPRKKDGKGIVPKLFACNAVLGIAAYFLYRTAYRVTGMNAAAIAAAVILSALLYGIGIVWALPKEVCEKMPALDKVYQFFEKSIYGIKKL